MELKEFVSKSIIAIIEGVVEAQSFAKDNGAKINPSNLTAPTVKYYSDDGVLGQDIEFDVAVVVSETKEGKMNAGISVCGIGAGGHKSKETENSTTSRIKFSVPLLLPIQKK